MKHIRGIGMALTCCFISHAPAERLHGLERMERLDALPYFLEGTQVRQVSSYDRSGGNHHDGFTGKYSALYVDAQGEYVLFDEYGAGCVYRFWMTYDPSHVDYAQARIRFYFDGDAEARLDLSIDEFFSGTEAPLLFPLAGRRHQSSHGYYSYLPFPYRDRLKITLSRRPFFYNITYHRYDTSDGVQSWTGEEDISTVLAQWNAVGIDPKPSAGNSVQAGHLTLPAGSTGTLFQAVGQGSIQRILLDPGPISSNLMRAVRLQASWDGAPMAVDVPLGDFFGSAWRRVNVTALPLGMRTSGDWYCYFPMPFWESADIRLVNTGDEPLPSLPFEIHYQTNGYERSRAGYFHALYREETLENDGRDYLFLKTQGRGHLVGISLFMESTGSGGYMDMAYLEGDERAYIDGAESPAIHGTGNEDYFNAGWYFNQGVFCRPYHGHPWREQFSVERPNQTQAYRFHLSDIITFMDSLRFGIEHGPQNDSPGTFASVAYFYKSGDTRTGLQLVGDMDAGDPWSEGRHAYTLPADAVPLSATWRYTGDDSFLPLSDTGHLHHGAVGFSVPLIVPNAGLRLRRRTDQGLPGRQKASVYVNDVLAGIWYEGDENFTEVNLRWLDSEFMIHSNLLTGADTANIYIVPEHGYGPWNAFRYQAFCVKTPLWSEDSDGDGIPDDWKLKYVDDIADLPADRITAHGYTVMDKYIAGTNPLDPEDILKWRIGDDTRPRFFSVLGRLYDIEEAVDLISGDWQPVRGGVPGSNGFVDIPPGETKAKGIYRIRVTYP